MRTPGGRERLTPSRAPCTLIKCSACENAGLGEGELTLAHRPLLIETGDAFERASQLCHPDEVAAMSGFNQREKNLD